MINNIIFLPIIFFIGLVTSYEDLRYSKIRNKWILIGLIYACVLYLSSWIIYYLSLSGITNNVLAEISSGLVHNFDKWCVNLITSIIVAYSLWYFKMWGAGDAKLFICYSALIPMGQYSRVYFNYYFASFSLLLSIFIPATAYLFLRSCAYFIKKFNFGKLKKQTAELIKEKSKFNKIELSKVFFGFLTLFLAFKVLRQALQNLIGRILPDQNILMLIALLLFKKLSKMFKKNTKFIMITFVFLILYFVYTDKRFIFEIKNTFISTVLIMLLFPMLKKIIDFYSERTIQKTTPFAFWMFSGALITWFL
ncbi:MAG: prepilin peptidase [Candidatus Omnitrophota bacterium]|nr:prepilin peptidase [Candidatus Omnitrophota bacterium]